MFKHIRVQGPSAVYRPYFTGIGIPIMNRKTVLRPSNLYNSNLYIGKIGKRTSLY